MLSCKNSAAILFKCIVVITDFQQFPRYCQNGKNVKNFSFDVTFSILKLFRILLEHQPMLDRHLEAKLKKLKMKNPRRRRP